MWLYCIVVVMCASVISTEEQPWWKTVHLYQIYPRSFKDSNGDGVGDLKGIKQKADYLKEIGVDAIWISPIFKSPMADFGYDISDFRNIDPTFGTMDDLRDLLKKFKSLDIKLLLDLVPNHSSDEHEWFQKSVQRIDPYTDYYVWVDGKLDQTNGKILPPNNWMSFFSGSAWAWNEGRKQFYLHQFDKKQPDLNYRNPRVRAEMDAIITFWLDKGIDGFRVDAVLCLFEDPSLRDEPPLKGTTGATFNEMDHLYTQNLPETYDLLNHWAGLIFNFTLRDGKPRAMFLEGTNDLSKTLPMFGIGNRNLMQPFNFQLMETNESTTAVELRDLITEYVSAVPKGASGNWVTGNHDTTRIANRYGPETVDAMNLLTGILPGVKVTYQGEEIGMQDTFIRWDQTVDPNGRLLGPEDYMEESRDPERTPMQWDRTISAGFSFNKTTWLPVNPNYWWLNVAAQRSAQSSHLKVFQAMAQIRKDPVLQRGDLNVLAPDDGTLVVVRKLNDSSFVLVFNMGSYIAEYTTQNLFNTYNLDMDMTVVMASISSEIPIGSNFTQGAVKFLLEPRAAVLLRSRSSSAPSAAGHLVSTFSLIMATHYIHFWWSACH